MPIALIVRRLYFVAGETFSALFEANNKIPTVCFQTAAAANHDNFIIHISPLARYFPIRDMALTDAWGRAILKRFSN
jgi:hypothetical protein